MTKAETIEAIQKLGGTATVKQSKTELTSILQSLQNATPATPATPADPATPATPADPATPATPATYAIYDRKTGKITHTTECISVTDSAIFKTISDLIATLYPAMDVSVSSIPMVDEIHDLKTSKSAGVKSGGEIIITAERYTKIPASSERAWQECKVCTLTINNGGAFDTHYFFDPKDATPKDLAVGLATMAVDADGNIMMAKLNTAGVVIKRRRDINFILSHTVKRCIDVALERHLRSKGIIGNYYVRMGSALTVD